MKEDTINEVSSGSDKLPRSPSFVTVDRAQYIAWFNGILMDFRNGKGIVVNESEAIAADEALARGEPVLLRNGSRLIGRYLTAEGDDVHEHEGFPVNTSAQTH